VGPLKATRSSTLAASVEVPQLSTEE